MDWPARIWRWGRRLRRRADIEHGLDDELLFHVEQQTAKNVRAGMATDEARRQALLQFGAVERTKEQTRDEFRASHLEDLWRDVRYAVRRLGRTPGFTFVAVLTLAIGIGATTAVFSLVNSILLRPLPYPESERLVSVKHHAPGLGLEDAGLSAGTYFHYAEHTRSFQGLAVYQESVGNVGGDDRGTERAHLTYAGPELFEVLRVRPALGRLFTREDGARGFMDMTWTVPVLISHDFWQSRYGGDPGIAGRVITLDETPRVILGVLPEGFAFPRPDTQIWVLSMPSKDLARLAGSLSYGAIARLRSDVTPAAASAELTAILPRIAGTYPDATTERLAELQLTPFVTPLLDDVVGRAGPTLWVLFGGMAFVLLVACANVANLFLVRAEHRDREIAVRKALGAGRAAIARLLSGEAFVLAAGGAVAGWLLATWAVSSLIAFAPIGLPRLGEVRLDGRAFAFTLTVAALSALVFGGLSLRRRTGSTAERSNLARGLRTTTTGRGSGRVRNALVAAQVAFALALLAGSALMAQSFWRLTHVEPGFAPDNVLTIEVGMPGNRANRYRATYGELLNRVRALPGVRSATAASFVPLAGALHVFPVQVGVAGQPSANVETPVPLKFVMPDYFQVMGTRILEGIDFGPRGDVDVPQPVWVSAALARRLFRGESAVGRQIRRLESNGAEVTMFDRARGASVVPPFTIAGVVADVAEDSLRQGPSEIVYIPLIEPAVERSIVPVNMTLAIRTAGEPFTIAASVRQVIEDLDPALSIARIRPLSAIVAASTATETFLAVLLLFGAVVSLFLGALGVYGVVAQAVRRRTREIGVRIALGAQTGDVVGMVLSEVTGVVVVGAVVGLVTALAATRALQSFLFGVEPADVVTLVAVTTILCGVALVAAWMPSRRATRVDPVVALKVE
ncbi:MAG: hypothetical protein ABS36_14980 [Acidobacteria bacterium SCN 69-37]|nr:MAG: hypothetical protein ABS36_14980 [Acidobacteria bacterium SCN 69-37]